MFYKNIRRLPLVEFARPHTIIGTTIAVFILYLMAVAETHQHSLPTLMIVYSASIAVNLYIVGLNQLTDIEIDKINKPYLPLAAGTMTFNTGLVIVIIAGVLSLILSAIQGRYFFGTIGIVFIIGTMYSLPPFRLKRSPFLAATAISLARAVISNAGVYLTYTEALTGKATLPPHILLFIGCMVGFVIVIALMKDIPDLEGDRRHQIATLVGRLGAARTLDLCHMILSFCYVGTIAVVLLSHLIVNTMVLAISHGVALILLWIMAYKVNPKDKDDIYRHYMFIWKLFYIEFIVFAASCLI